MEGIARERGRIERENRGNTEGTGREQGEKIEVFGGKMEGIGKWTN